MPWLFPAKGAEIPPLIREDLGSVGPVLVVFPILRGSLYRKGLLVFERETFTWLPLFRIGERFGWIAKAK